MPRQLMMIGDTLLRCTATDDVRGIHKELKLGGVSALLVVVDVLK